MKKTDSQLFSDVEQLLKQSVIEEASSKIWSQFEQALSSLDTETAEVLTQYFRGSSIEQIGVEKNLSPSDVEAWLAKAKRELTHQLRIHCHVRQ